MEIHSALQKYTADQRYKMSSEQEAIIRHDSGPLLVIAGPGSGKTYSLSMLAMNLFLHNAAEPSEFVLCTYTEKAALEIRDRITHIAREVQYSKDVYQMRIDTIHGICRQIIAEHLHETELANGYETLDQFPQQLLIYEHLQTICSPQALQIFQERWGSPWKIVQELSFCFDKIVDELIADDLKKDYPVWDERKPRDQQRFLKHLTKSYINYQNLLLRTHRMDFAHLQKQVYDLLLEPGKAHAITMGIRYVLVDEYQDTNYIQEQILFRLAMTGNLCVVGDEDQALYRFRGATVRNLLEFKQSCEKQAHFPPCKEVQLTTNYRSHPKIIQHCNDWMSQTDWSNPTGTSVDFRTQKHIKPVKSKEIDTSYNAYAAVLTITAHSDEDEATQFADLVETLKAQGLITEYHQVALLLHSVKPTTSKAYADALLQRGIPYYCPRARNLFEQDEVLLMFGCLARLLNYRERNDGTEDNEIAAYLRRGQQLLEHVSIALPEFARELDMVANFVEQQVEVHTLVLDCFYRLLAHEPFFSVMHEPRIREALVELSGVLGMFQRCYARDTIQTMDGLQNKFFHTFLRFLQKEGVNLRELPQRMLPAGRVQIMTIHQAKGLEFPVVVVGKLDKKPPHSDSRDSALRPFYHKLPFEPERLVAGFDLARHYYVAFSRAEHLLVLSASGLPNEHIAPFFKHLPRLIPAQRNTFPRTLPLKVPGKQFKQRYSFTQHVTSYEGCPRRYEYFHEHGFLPSQLGDFFLGQAVHQTLENIHRIACSDHRDSLNEDRVHKLFGRVADCLEQKSRAVQKGQREKALQQVLTYFYENEHMLQYVQNIEQAISVEKDNYILVGKLDLFMEIHNELCLFDFKTERKQQQPLHRIERYERQLHTYAHILEQRNKKKPDRLFLYWTGEERREDALMEVHSYQGEDEAAAAGKYFDEVVASIQSKDFTARPHKTLCLHCDLRNLCRKDGTL